MRGELFFFFQAEDGIRGRNVTGVQTCALPIYNRRLAILASSRRNDPATSQFATETEPLPQIPPLELRSGFRIHQVARNQIGRASCRERVSMSVVAGR